MWLCGDVLYRQSGNLEARFALYLVKFARGKHRMQVGMIGALVKFYEETGGAWRAAYLPGKTTRAREVRGGNQRKKGVHHWHLISMASGRSLVPGLMLWRHVRIFDAKTFWKYVVSRT